MNVKLLSESSAKIHKMKRYLPTGLILHRVDKHIIRLVGFKSIAEYRWSLRNEAVSVQMYCAAKIMNLLRLKYNAFVIARSTEREVDLNYTVV